jgi:NTE family protein
MLDSRKIYLFILFQTIAGFFGSTYLNGQKVALVLSGGGSRGVAHVGVIKALEENNIPIDYITGTSIGAIIGGLYANGMSPSEIEKLVESEEFQNWSEGEIADKYIYFYQKKSPDASWVTFRFNYNATDSIWKHKLPTNFYSPLQLDFAFMELFSGATTVSNGNFDSLFVPFRCVAADIEGNKPVVFKSGDLGKSIRASMTFPFYFKPISIEGKLLFDGGIYNNFPSDVAFEDFYPDFIIGSKVATNFDSPNEDDILTQIENMLVSKTNYSTICEASILIKPNLENTSLFDFSNSAAYVDSGYNATIKLIDSIKLFISRKVSIDSLNTKRDSFCSKKPELKVDKIYINGLNKNEELYIRQILRKNNFLHKNRLPIPFNEFKARYFKLFAEDDFENIFPLLVYNSKTSFYDFYLDVKRKKTLLLDFGGNISSNPNNEAYFQLQYKDFRRFQSTFLVNMYFGKFYGSGKAAVRLDFPYNRPFYIEPSFTYNHWDFFKSSTPFFEDKTPSYLIQSEYHGGLDVGMSTGNASKLVTGFAFGSARDDYYQTNYFSRIDVPDKTYFDFYTSTLYFERSTLNSKQFPNKGTYLLFKFRHIRGNELYVPGTTAQTTTIFEKFHEHLYFKAKYINYFKTYKRLKLGFFTETVLSTQELFSNYTASLLAAPAFEPIPESKTIFLPYYRNHVYSSIGLDNIIIIRKKIDFRIGGYIFQPYREIIKDDNLTAYYGEPFATRYYIASGALVYKSPIGPVSLCLNYYNNANTNFSVVFNIGYVLFNSKAND